jgi:hypothetical protein
LVASTEETTEQDDIAATTDEKVDPQEETKDSEDPAAKSTKVPTDPEAPAAMSNDKSSGANSEEKQTTELKGNNIGDELQAEAGKKNSLPPNAEIANNTNNQSQSSDSDDPAFFSSLEEVPIKATGSKAVSFQLSIGGFMSRSTYKHFVFSFHILLTITKRKTDQKEAIFHQLSCVFQCIQ